MVSAFASTAPRLVARGHSPIPIMPGSKSPGVRNADGEWQPMPRWHRWCKEQPTEHTIAAWLRMIGGDNAGVGVACGMGLICIDIDFEECMAPLLAILPVSHVQKKGKKGVSLFYRGNTDVIRSRNFRTPDKVGLVDLLSEGKQTVLPPSIHPDTGEPYYWWTDDTLLDTPLEDLTELPDDIADRIGEVLKQFGYDPDGDRRYEHGGDNERYVASAGGSDARTLFQQVNDAAMAAFAAWVPKIGFTRYRRTHVGYEATAPWRSSGSGKPFNRRKLNLKFHPLGIKDFGTMETFTPIDVVMKAHPMSAGAALEWLAPLVGVELHDPVVAAMAAAIVENARKKKERA